MRLISFAFALLFFVSCASRSTNYTSEIQQIDSLKTEVLAAQERYAQIDAIETQRILNVIKEDMSKMTMKFKNQMSEEDALVFSEYNSAKRLIKDFPKQHKNILRETDRTLNQLTLFRNALDSAATVDAVGNKIDAEYVKKQLAQEKKVADGLIEQIDLSIGYATEAQKEFHRLEGQIRTLLTETIEN